MSRSFDCVDFKLAEADFFLERMKSCTLSIWEVNFYFSAFVSAARSVTFALQAVMDGQPGFAEWYSKKQSEMRGDPVCRFFVTYRNEVLKTGELPIVGGYMTPSNCKPGKFEIKHRFSRSMMSGNKLQPLGRTEFIQRAISDHDGGTCEEEPDAVASCCEYMQKVAALVASCYTDFGPIIDPDQHYTLDNLRKINKSVEDVEEELGFPRGWTAIGEDTNEEERLRALRTQIPRSGIKHLFEKYCSKQPA
jgi:hypothetical protein